MTRRLVWVAAGAALLTAVVFFFPGPHHRAPFRMNHDLYTADKLEHRGAVKQPSDWFMLQRIWPQGELDTRAVDRARSQAARMRSAASDLDETWQFEGPTNVGGRITAFAVHPDHPNVVYAGAALGGVFKSVDGGLNFSPVFELDSSLSIGALAMDPDDSLTVWAGTGEANSSGDSYPGTGLYVTHDGGASWAFSGLGHSSHIGRITIDPTDTDRMYVAAMGALFGTNPERGLYRSQDGGQTWDRVLFVNDSTGCIDVDINPRHPDSVYAVTWQRIRRPFDRSVAGPGSGLWLSTDGGTNWERLTNGLPTGGNVGRGSIALAPSNPSRIYYFLSDHPGYFLGAYRSDDGGLTWTSIESNNFTQGSLYSSFGWYFGEVEVDPYNPDAVFALGVGMFRSIDGGEHWNQVFSDAHVDHHALWIDPGNTSHIYDGNDGGVYSSNTYGNSVTSFHSLPVTQFYAITHDASNPQRLFGGTQDNSTPGTLEGGTGDWTVFYYGDGFYCRIDPRDSQRFYMCYQYGGLGRSEDNGVSWNSINSDFYDDRSNWMTPYTLDPFNSDRLYLGTYRVWRSDFRGDSWTPISDDLTDGEGAGNLVYNTITTLEVSPADSDEIWVGTDDSHVWITRNGGSTWSDVSSDLPRRWVTRVTPHLDSANVAYVCFSGYTAQDLMPHLFRTSDFGATWTSASGNLPEGPVNDVIVDPDSSGWLYVGTDFGVFVSMDYGESWKSLGEGLPMSPVFDLEFISVERRLVAGTHGRSMYSYDLGTLSGVNEGTPAQPSEFVLSSYPNPFNLTTRVSVTVPESGRLDVRVFDLLGREVCVLANRQVDAGRYDFTWDGRSGTGAIVASGTYLVMARQGDRTANSRVTLVK